MRHSFGALARIRFVATGLIGLIIVLRYGSDEAQLIGTILILWGVIGDITMNVDVTKVFMGDSYEAGTVTLNDKRPNSTLNIKTENLYTSTTTETIRVPRQRVGKADAVAVKRGRPLGSKNKR